MENGKRFTLACWGSLILTDPASKEHIELGKKLGIDVSRDSAGVAAARLDDEVAVAFGRDSPRPSTDGQRQFARQFEVDVSGDTFRVAASKIKIALINRKLEEIREAGLEPGVQVVYLYKDPKYKWGKTYTISEIGWSGNVYCEGLVYPFPPEKLRRLDP